ncbi:MAG: hypothetical protein E7262_10090 [Lachnospiraceae bacterium]|nr:hypothetical protein [Lachnospiraceae bacterium]
MSKFEEKKYKQSLTEDTPDLWDKVNNALPDDMYTTDSAPDMNTKPTNTSTPKEKKKLKPSKIYKVAGIIAACLCLVSVPLILKAYNSNNIKTALNTEVAKDSMPIQEDSIGNEAAENGVLPDLNSNSAPLDDNGIASKKDILDNKTDTDKSSNPGSAGSPTNQGSTKPSNNEDTKDTSMITKPSLGNNTTTDNRSNAFLPKNEGGEHLKEGELLFEITELKQVPKIGLVYKGVVKASQNKTIAAQCQLYISLSQLSRTELGKKHEVGSQITITVKDTSYASCLDKPYYAGSISYEK